MISDRVIVTVAQNHMATTFRFKMSCKEQDQARAKRLLEECHQAVADLESELTEFREDSPVFQLNHSPSGKKIPVPASLLELLNLSAMVQRKTKGAFDPFSKSKMRSSLIKPFGWDLDEGVAWKNEEGAWLGFGAIGKGYALDIVRTIIVQNGFEDFLLSSGGSSIVVSGFENDNVPWEWSWSWAKQDSENIGLSFHHESGHPIAFGISGNMEQGNHIIRRGEKINCSDWQSTFIAHPSAAIADALSTAAFVGDWKEVNSFVEKEIYPTAIATVDQDHNFRWNEIFENLSGISRKFAVILASMSLPLMSFAEDVVDLEALNAGVETFNPYLYERNTWWLVLPALALMFILLHLRAVKPRRRPKLAIKPPRKLKRLKKERGRS